MAGLAGEPCFRCTKTRRCSRWSHLRLARARGARHGRAVAPYRLPGWAGSARGMATTRHRWGLRGRGARPRNERGGCRPYRGPLRSGSARLRCRC